MSLKSECSLSSNCMSPQKDCEECEHHPENQAYYDDCYIPRRVEKVLKKQCEDGKKCKNKVMECRTCTRHPRNDWMTDNFKEEK